MGAEVFAQEFYGALLEGESVGEAVRSARAGALAQPRTRTARSGPRTSTTAIRRARPGSEPEPEDMADEDLLARYSPYLQYDSLESFRADSAAMMAEHFFDDGAKWSYANVLREKGGKRRSRLHGPKEKSERQLDLAFLGKRYANGQAAQATDFLDAAGRRYVEDARRLHGDPRYADRTYGHVVRESSGATWLQYWFFYYYNDKNFFGIGLHEGDWEMIQLRLGRDGEPNAATFAQHRDGEALNWSDLELEPSPDGDVPVVYVGRGSHASFASRRRALSDAPPPLPRLLGRQGARSCDPRSRSSPTTRRSGCSGPASGARATRARPGRARRASGRTRRRSTEGRRC